VGRVLKKTLHALDNNRPDWRGTLDEHRLILVDIDKLMSRRNAALVSQTVP
jgi:hypothetical protein